ncbi:MAG TPA: energy-coupling factor ABC transporter permease [Pirellulales bacterium]|jgi:cobalt/nickel transport system permease protein|nr:energy-coupling factor ABC transporter permease [Pirellulales bacterium]
MHLPDHYLDPTTCAVTSVAAAGALAFAAFQARREGSQSVRLMAATSAGIFAAQMVNFPIASGTSGHLIGGVLAGAVLGPWLGTWAIAIVLAVQCLLFGDGGISTLGANILNMGVAGSVLGYAAFQGIQRFASGPLGKVVAAAAASWVTVVAAAALCSCELAAAGTFRFGDVLPAMVGMHALIGVCEALITAAVMVLLLRVAPTSLYDSSRRLGANSAAGWRKASIVGLAAALLIALALAPWASTAPDGLERVAGRLGLAKQGGARLISAPIADYKLTGIDSPAMAIALAGAIGVAAAFSAAGLSTILMRRRMIAVPAESRRQSR